MSLWYRIRLEGRRLVTITDGAPSLPEGTRDDEASSERFDTGLSLAEKKGIVIDALKHKDPRSKALCKALFDELVEEGMDQDVIEIANIVEWNELDSDESSRGIRDRIRSGLEDPEGTWYRLIDLRDSKGRRAYVVGLTSGEAEELNWTYVGSFFSRRKAMAAVRREGIISVGQRRRL